MDQFGIEFNGILVGWVADVVTEKTGADHGKITDISFPCGTGMKKAFYDWIKDSIGGRHTRKGGTIVTATDTHTATARLSFTGALISEIGFPALDAASKDAAKMTVRLSPQATHAVPLPPSAAARALPAGPASPKPWLVSNFRIKIDGLDCSSVTRIGEITIAQKEPATVEIPNLVITLPESHAGSWKRWHEAFVIKGNNGDEAEKTGTLEYLAPDMKEVLFSLSFKLKPDKVESGDEGSGRVKAEMYCEGIEFKYEGGATWA
jgi:hypothetical protein